MGPACGEEGECSFPSCSDGLFADCVTQADEILRNDPELNHEYLPIAGLSDFTTASQKLVLGGDSPAIREKRVRTSLPTIA
jgi:aspartate aminotransferase